MRLEHRVRVDDSAPGVRTAQTREMDAVEEMRIDDGTE